MNCNPSKRRHLLWICCLWFFSGEGEEIEATTSGAHSHHQGMKDTEFTSRCFVLCLQAASLCPKWNRVHMKLKSEMEKKKILPERISSIFSPQNSQCWGLCVNLLETMLLLYVLTANLELTVTVPGNLQKQQELKNRYEYSRETAAEIKKQTQKPITKSQKT